jgi:uncharacterized membrane protein required for colicin V production
LLGGFAGAFLADVYALPLSGFVQPFPGSILIAGGVLFIGGLVAVLIPGLLLSRLSSLILLGFIDSVFGLVTGAVAGLCFLAVGFMLITSWTPRIEKKDVWKKSKLARAYFEAIEDNFQAKSKHRKRISLDREWKDLTNNSQKLIQQIKG